MDGTAAVARPALDVDIVCVGFGPAVGGFLTRLAPAIAGGDGRQALESRSTPGMPLQVVCYERADDVGFGVSGVVTRARGIRASFPGLDPAQIPSAHPVTRERVVYLRDPVGASRRSRAVARLDRLLRLAGRGTPERHHGVELPYIPKFMRKDGGLLLSIGQFNQWVATQLMATGLVQLWPGTPVGEPLIDGDRVVGVRLLDQGTDRTGRPEAGFMPGADIHAALTVVADGPVGPVGRRLDERFGLPRGHRRRDHAVGMKLVVDLPESCTLEAGTVIHTLGYPEPEIFGFLYVYTGRVASLGIFVPSWLPSPVRATYRYLQHWMMHPYLWRQLAGGTMRSWGAKTILESGQRGEPYLAGDGYARIGEGSGSTNVLAGSGVDEAWTTGVQLADAVIELLRRNLPFDRPNLEATYVRRRRESWVEAEARIARHARDGFQRGVLTGLFGMGLSGLTRGKFHFRAPDRDDAPARRGLSLAEYYRGKISPEEIEAIRVRANAAGASMQDALMARAGWPDVPHDGKLLVSHQDALLMGGKVQAPPGYADHVAFLYPHLCERCGTKVCIEVCSGQAIGPGEDGGVPRFDREKCIHCGACAWSCPEPAGDGGPSNVEFRAGAGGLHSAEN